MKLEVYDANKAEAKPPVRLQLKQGLRSVDVIVVDADGDPVLSGHLIRFTEDGTIFRHCGVASVFGFDLDGAGCINIE